jgi:hypothetical protein
MRSHMIALDAAVESSPLPQLSQLTYCDGATTSPCEITGDTVRVCGDSSGSFYEIHGRVTIPNFQEGTLPYEFPQDGGDIVYDTSGVPQQQGTMNVCFALTIPKSAMPAGGWPLVVHAHGTGGSFKDAVDSGMAESLASASVPMATLTYEGVASGERKGSSTRSSDSLMFNVVNPRAARDNNLQGAVDVIQTLRVAQIAPFTVGTISVAFDPTKLYYSGHSQGSNVGIPAIAVTGLTHTVIFSGAGSYLTDGIMTKTSPVNAKGALSAVIGEDLYDGHPVMTIWQTFFDRIDPLNYDAMIVATPPAGAGSKNVYMSWGQGDTYSPDKTLQLTAEVMRLGLASGGFEAESGLTTVNRPVSGNKVGGDGVTRTAATFQYVTDGTYDGHFVSYQNPMAVADWLAFLTSAATSGTPTVP